MKNLLKAFDHFELERIPQSKNDHANALAKIASMKMPVGNQLVVQTIMLPPLIKVGEVACVDTKDGWMDPIKAYLKNETFPKDKRYAEKIQKRSALYYLKTD